ncbi:MAG: hypothetical protein GY815_13280 [Gammaproteobacteria bacterium]|nr:hypothetical protein [Gammaproteobacteria bacterium]
MSTPIPTNAGHLSVDVESSSYYFSSNAPLEIRDGKMRLIKKAESERQFDLEPGLYQVTAVLEDGREHSQLVEIKGGEQSRVKIGGAEKPLGDQGLRFKQRSLRTLAEPNFTRADTSVEAELEIPFAVDVAAPNFTRADTSVEAELEIPFAVDVAAPKLLDFEGVKLVREAPGLWFFNSHDNVDNVPAATFEISGQKSLLSLPTSPYGGGAPNTCVVRIDQSSAGEHATAWIDPERTVANAFQNMLASGQLMHAAGMADQAVELLRDKYHDPTGATLGALILHKVGRLDRLQSWMENLARDFAWIPDGKILLANLLVNRRDDLDLALQLAVEASRQRMLYTDSYSILLDLLRRWPRETDRDGLLKVIIKLASFSPFINWNSICLSRNSED